MSQAMTLTNWIAETNYNLKGTDDDPPAANSSDWNYWVNILNRKKDEMYTDLNQSWASAFKPKAPNQPGTVQTAGTTALVGTNTNFTDCLPGDQITVSGETVRTIQSITDDTHLTVTAAFSTTGTGKTFTRTMIIQVGSQDFYLHRSLVSLAKKILVVDTSGQNHYIDVVKPQEGRTRLLEVYLYGDRPKTLEFSSAFLTGDPLIGGQMYAPGYYIPDDVDPTNANAIIPIDDPHWASMAVAAQVAFNDITYQDKFGDLNGQANVLYKNMAHKNRRGVYGNPRISKTNIGTARIRGFR